MTRRPVRARALAIATVAVAITITAAATACTPAPPQQTAAAQFPDGDAFYIPPSPLPPGNPGDVIRYTPVTARYFIFGTELNVNAWKVMYRSTNSLGQPIAVTATVMVPKGAYWGNRPIVSYPGGTKGMGDQCASSRTIPLGQEQEVPLLNGALIENWAVVMTDYEGLGTPGTHTYQANRSAGMVTLDAVRAAMRVPGAGLYADAPVGLWGYSQGGGAVGWAAQLAASYAPELQVKGAAAGGVPADLARVAAYDDGGEAFGFVAMAAVGLDAAYPELHLTNYLNATGLANIETIKTQCEADVVEDYAGDHMADYVTTNPLNTSAWKQRLTENKLGAIKPSVPVMLYAGTQDVWVPPAGGEALAASWCAMGAKVQWNDYGADHVGAAIGGAQDAVDYLHDRFDGVAAPSTC